MTKIVGHKRVRYLTVARRWPENVFHVGYHQRSFDLHATKGWRQTQHQIVHYDLPRAPNAEERRLATVVEFERINAKEAPMVERLKGIRP